MFRVARVLRGVSPFSVFLMDQKSNPSLKGVSIGKRGQMLSKMYKELSQRERKDLQQRAQKHPSLRKAKQAPKPRKKVTRNSEFSQFVRENYKVVKGLNYKKRFAALSQLYELRKPLDEQVAKAMEDVSKRKSVKPAKTAVKAAAKKAAKAPKKKAAAKKD